MITWREYRPADEAALRARHAAQCKAMRCEFAFPDLADPRYLLVLVAERDGEVVGAIVAHATLEVFFVGADAKVAKSAVREQGSIRSTLRARGCNEMHAFVPRRLLMGMTPILRRLGLRVSNQEYVAFYGEL